MIEGGGTELLILLDLVAVFGAAKLLEEVVARAGQPPVLGDLMAGIIVGPTVLGLVSRVHNVAPIAWVGIVTLIFLAGLETRVENLRRYGKRGALVAVGGVVASFALGLAVGWFMGHSLITSLFIATILSPTSVSVTVEALHELGMLRSGVGQVILTAAVADDIYALTLFSIVYGLAIAGAPDIAHVTMVAAGLALTVGVTYLVIRYSKAVSKFLRSLRSFEGIVSFMLLYGLGMALLTTYFRLSPLVGAYFAGLSLAAVPGAALVREDKLPVLTAVLTPLFFVYAGILLNPWEVSGLSWSTIETAALVVAAGVAGKVLGCGASAYLAGYGLRESALIGFGMMPRAGVDLVIAVTGLQLGVLTQDLYLGAMALIYVTSLATPPIMKRLSGTRGAR